MGGGGRIYDLFRVTERKFERSYLRKELEEGRMVKK